MEGSALVNTEHEGTQNTCALSEWPGDLLTFRRSRKQLVGKVLCFISAHFRTSQVAVSMNLKCAPDDKECCWQYFDLSDIIDVTHLSCRALMRYPMHRHVRRQAL